MNPFERRLAKAEEQASLQAGGELVRIFFQPRPCPDPESFARQCEAEAGKAQAVIVRFVRPGEVPRPTDTLQ